MLAGVWLHQVSSLEVFAFMEYLFLAGIIACNITYYIIAITFVLILYGCDTTPFKDLRIALFVKEVIINRLLNPVIHFYFGCL